jgi:hypothetical protein
MDIYLATEDALSEAVGERLVADASDEFSVAVRIGNQGNSFLKKKLPELIRLAHSMPVVLLTDLDGIDCAPTLIREWKGGRRFPNDLLFRVIIREIESWLMADRESFSDFTGVPLNRLPMCPDSIPDPKQLVLNLIRKYGRLAIKRELLPSRGRDAVRGFGYNPVLRDYVINHWSPAQAAIVSNSLSRARLRLQELGA